MERPGAQDRQSIRIWDLPLRLFHWLLALLFVSQVATATIGGNAMEYHALGGYAILALLLFRIAWGFVGGTHARFTDFVRGPAAVMAHLRGRLAPRAGHNPLGGWSILAMLLSLLVQAATGLLATDDVMMEGPLAKHVPESVVGAATSIHDINAVVLLSLVGLHLAAVAYYLVARGQNLILPMVTGRRDEAGSEPPHRGSALSGALIAAAAGTAVYFIVTF